MDKFKANAEQNRPLNFPNTAFDIIAIAASAGGLKALSEVFSNLPSNLPAAIVVVQYLDRRYRSLMAEILSQRTPLEVKEAETGDLLKPGTIYNGFNHSSITIKNDDYTRR